MNYYRDFSKNIITVLFTLTLLNGCSYIIFPESQEFADFRVENKPFQIRVSPYMNAMPGSSSNEVIIPINFWMHNNDQGEEWPRKFKITKVEISNVDMKFTQISNLDHDDWIHNRQDGNTLRIPLDKADRYLQKIIIWFKDDKGKRYKVVFHKQYAGNVY